MMQAEESSDKEQHMTTYAIRYARAHQRLITMLKSRLSKQKPQR
jgi:hypothetical protein